MKKYLLYGVIAVITFLLAKSYFMFTFLTLICGIIGYYHDRINKTVFDFRLGLVFGIIIMRYYGFVFTLIYFILSTIIPNILAGGRLDGPTLIFYFEYFLLFFAVSFFPYMNIITLGLLLVLADGILGFFINAVLGIPWILVLSAQLVAILIRIIYFLTLGEIIVFMFTI